MYIMHVLHIKPENSTDCFFVIFAIYHYIDLQDTTMNMLQEQYWEFTDFACSWLQMCLTVFTF